MTQLDRATILEREMNIYKSMTFEVSQIDMPLSEANLT